MVEMARQSVGTVACRSSECWSFSISAILSFGNSGRAKPKAKKQRSQDSKKPKATDEIMLINVLLFWMMVTEAMICLVISLPFGKGVTQSIIQFLSTHLGGKDSIASTLAKVITGLVTVLFLCK